MQVLKIDDTTMWVVTDDIYLTWINSRPYGIKFAFHKRWVKAALQWGKDE